MTSDSIVNGVWPKSPTKMTIDNACECPLCSGIGCDLDTCHCIHETTYNLTLESAAPTGYNLCLQNILEEMNGMYVQFFHDSLQCLSISSRETLFPIIYRVYIDSYKISISKYLIALLHVHTCLSYMDHDTAELPGPPVLNVEQDLVCFESASLPAFPVQQYELSIYDVTGERRFFRNVSAITNCTSVRHMFEEATCAPFEVTVRAYNQNGHSSITSHVAGNETGE